MTTTRFRTVLMALVTASVAFAGTACSGTDLSPTGPTPTPPQPVAPVVLQSLTITAPTTLEVGRDATFTARAIMSDGSTAPATSGVIWSSSDQRILAVNQNGLGSAIASGVVTVAAQYQGKSSTAPVTVTAPATPAVNVSGLWKLTTSPVDARGGCDLSENEYEIRLSQSGTSVSATSLAAVQSGPRPIMLLKVLSYQVTGTARDANSVVLNITFREEYDARTTFETSGVFTGALTGTTISGTFNGTVREGSGRGTCRSSNHSFRLQKR